MTVRSHLAGILLVGCVMSACSRDMQEQPSFVAQEAPRKHSPAGSVPINSREALPAPPPRTPEIVNEGERLFAINCAHCHGSLGDGDGPVAGDLSELPANLHAPQVQKHSAVELYQTITEGKDVMPAFKGELSAKDRWAIAYFVKSLETAKPAAPMETTRSR
jgi:mono/diheme cytochrome c family protein